MYIFGRHLRAKMAFASAFFARDALFGRRRRLHFRQNGENGHTAATCPTF
eukprot:NODE_11262_length_414_cov_2.605479_g10134_i0.p5 GENE.NODE_11262_length_414_cov_2.605479_g10134_i0~~NODE_11262_length_414_cov_2.605479_g10134_i0.p5  ORF type:complete len:50 (-),score=1.07 NODE_11262_length_414_cov_2.605479_g10134_i0:114-263(-)